MDAPAYPDELSNRLIESEANQLLGSTLETQPQFSADANQQSCVSPTCSAGCCVVLASVGGQGGLLPDCACARGSRFRGCKRRIWRSSELSTLVLLHSALGNKWSAIAKYLHGRSDNDCKNIFYSALRSKTSQTNRLLRTYAQAVGPNCDDPLARQNAYKAAKAQVAARNASLISRAAALVPRPRQASGRGGGSTSDEDSDVPANAAAAAAQAAAAFPQADAAAAAAVAAAADGDAPEDMDPMDAGAYVSALQLQQATAAAAAAATAGGVNGSMDHNQSSNPSSRALIRRLSAQSGNRDSSMYGGGGGSPSIAPSFPQETAAAAAAPPPSRSYSQAYRDAQDNRAVGTSRQNKPVPPPPQHHQQQTQRTQQQQPAWAASSRGLLPPAVPHTLRRQRLMPFGPHPSPLSGGMITVALHDGAHLAGQLTYTLSAEAIPENFGAPTVGAASSTESLHDASSAPSMRRGSGGGVAAATAPVCGSAIVRKDKTRDRDASSGAGSTSSFGAVKSEWSGNTAMATGSPGDTATVLQISATSGGNAGPTSVQGQGQPPPHMAAAGSHSVMALEVRGSGSYPPETTCTPTGPSPHDVALVHPASATSHTADAPTPPILLSYQHHHHPTYSSLSLSLLPTTGSGPIPSPPASGNNSANNAQGQGLHPANAPTPLSRVPVPGAPILPFAPLPSSTCEEMLPSGSTGPVHAAGCMTQWETPPPTSSAGTPPGPASAGPVKYDMLPPPVTQGSGMLVYSNGGWELSSLELVPCGSTGSGGATPPGTFAVLPPAPQMLQQQQHHHQYHLGLQLQAQLEAQQQQLQEQQLQLQLQLAQLQALQHQHQRLQHLQQHGQSQGQPNAQQQGQESPPSVWVPTNCGNPSPPLPPPAPAPPLQPPQQQPQQQQQQHQGMRTAAPPLQLSPVGRMVNDAGMHPPPGPGDDALTEMWLSMLD